MDTKQTHWSGIDVAKENFDAAVVFLGQHFPQTALHEVPAQSFARTREGVRQFMAWLDAQLARRNEKTQAGLHPDKLLAWRT